ncbi:hypothetical protein P152DRAFT_513203 [Eremomyces bilateralis CBS 781.70]|uniref:Uncharacterized protein n=1 Tax=Eremomyces bilateralis CBS 781.70 TaxID=1392243 RepID=A0A6G1G6X0_9PEZI|nr:uncharacterized protein P152DRAFT_513203 [Eremomyces bilateralis CBS 781.70]KAF1813835.1 hypothetical protein P152DRAFT_513203 [Eremomyces bilateralis CBS 781.70]
MCTGDSTGSGCEIPANETPSSECSEHSQHTSSDSEGESPVDGDQDAGIEEETQEYGAPLSRYLGEAPEDEHWNDRARIESPDHEDSANEETGESIELRSGEE